MKTENKELTVFVILALLATCIYYGPSANNFFAYDDFKYLENFSGNFVNVLFGYNTLRVVSNLTWWPLYHFSGLDPRGYAWFGILLNATNAVLLYLFLSQLSKEKLFAFLAGLFFVFNSVGADAVLWKATNSSLINLFFYLSTLNAYLYFRRESSKWAFAVALACYLLATFSKEEAASLPFILVLIELIFLEGWRDKKGVALRVAPFAAMVPVYLFSNWLVFNHLLQANVNGSVKVYQLR
ncbi:hypothetical protein [Geomonas sp. Red276]